MKNKPLKESICEQNEVIYELDEERCTASILKSQNSQGHLIIPKSIEHKSKNYTIKEIKKEAFSYNKTIISISFSNDSELNIIDKESFSNSSLMSIYIPDTVENLQEGFGNGAYLLTDIQVSPTNKKLSYVNNSYLIYDNVLIFARRNIEKAVIPSNIKRIAERAFDSCCELTSLTFSSNETIEEICNYAFYHCSNLKQIELPSSLKKMDDYSFYYCDKIEKVDFLSLNESKLLKIGKGIFFNSSLKSLTIPPSVTEIKEGFFLGIDPQIELKLSPQNKHFINYNDDFIISKNVILFVRKNIETAVIPSFITRIGDGAFDHCIKLKSILFENDINNISEIGQYSFSFCTNLKKFEISSNITCIENYAFNKCLSLESFEIPQLVNEEDLNEFKIKKIGINAFNQCNSLKNVSLPPSVVEISKESFNECQNLEKFEFVENKKSKSMLVHIDDFAFSNCINLEKIVIPSHIKKIGRYVFRNCAKLSICEFNDDSNLEYIGSCAFHSTNIEHLEIPSKVCMLEDSCFYGTLKSIHINLSPKNKDIVLLNNNLFVCNDDIVFSNYKNTAAYIPSNIKKIGGYAFSNNYKLKSITFLDYEKSELTEIADSAFSHCRILEKFNVIPAKVKIIGASCFYSAESLNSIEILSDDIILDEYCFEKCLNFSLVSFPNAKVININYHAFFNVGDCFLLFTIQGTNILE